MVAKKFGQFFIVDKIKHLSTEGLGWFAVILLHCATIPSVISLMLGFSDHLPTVDVVLFVWAGLVLLFLKAIIKKDMLSIITISGGFIIQAILLGLVVYK
jgi:hypothetical protein